MEILMFLSFLYLALRDNAANNAEERRTQKLENKVQALESEQK